MKSERPPSPPMMGVPDWASAMTVRSMGGGARSAGASARGGRPRGRRPLLRIVKALRAESWRQPVRFWAALRAFAVSCQVPLLVMGRAPNWCHARERPGVVPEMGAVVVWVWVCAMSSIP